MEHNWTILNEKILPELSGETNVLTTIWFRLTTVDGSGNTFDVDGRVHLNINNLDSFKPYEQITFSDRINWIKGHAGDFYENYNLARISQ